VKTPPAEPGLPGVPKTNLKLSYAKNGVVNACAPTAEKQIKKAAAMIKSTFFILPSFKSICYLIADIKIPFAKVKCKSNANVTASY
jgi:hypothetical protein